MADNESKEIIKNREKQLRDMAEIIADLNQQLNESQVKNKQYKEEIEVLQKKLERKDNLIKQELQDKELLFSKLQSSDNEITKLKIKMNQPTNSSIQGTFSNMFKTFQSKIQSKSQQTQIQTSQVQRQQPQQTQELGLIDLKQQVSNHESNESNDYDDEEMLARIRANIDYEDNDHNDNYQKKRISIDKNNVLM